MVFKFVLTVHNGQVKMYIVYKIVQLLIKRKQKMSSKRCNRPNTLSHSYPLVCLLPCSRTYCRLSTRLTKCNCWNCLSINETSFDSSQVTFIYSLHYNLTIIMIYQSLRSLVTVVENNFMYFCYLLPAQTSSISTS